MSTMLTLLSSYMLQDASCYILHEAEERGILMRLSIVLYLL